jgi:hypothetical protein
VKIALVVAVACGCGSVTVTRLHAPPHAMPARGEDAVDVFAFGAPERPHVDVARIEAHGRTGRKSLELQAADFVPELHARAAALGCDAIVLGPWMRRTADDGRTAICIAYTDIVEDVAVPAPPLLGTDVGADH